MQPIQPIQPDTTTNACAPKPKPMAQVIDPHQMQEAPSIRHTHFVNDLTPEDIDKAVAEYAARIRAQLSEPILTVNTMSRLMNVAFHRTAKILELDCSAKKALLGQSTNKVVRAAAMFDKLTDEERELLLSKVKADK